MRLTALPAFFLAASAAAGPFQNRWFYCSRNFNNPKAVEEIGGLLETARRGGLNGMLLAAGLEYVHRWPREKLERLERVKKAAAEAGVEIIPLVWSVGYGTMLGIDPNLAAGMPCDNVPYIVRDGRIVPDPAPLKLLKNPDFELHDGDKFPGFAILDGPGKISFADHEALPPGDPGKTSLRLEAANTGRHGHARACAVIDVAPRRRYTASARVKTRGLRPADKSFRLQIYTEDGRYLAGRTFPFPRDADWQTCGFSFNSCGHSRLRFYFGLWGARGGTVWIDNLRIDHTPLTTVLRRPGTPFSVRNADTGEEYAEGRDYLPVPPLADISLLRRKRPAPLTLTPAPGSRIPDCARLLVSAYQPEIVVKRQISVCMSEPRLYDLFRESAAAVQKALAPRKWFLSMDEIRAGGSCAACRKRGLDMARILGDCLHRQRGIIKGVNPAAEIYVWSDMLDPAHNAVREYFCCEGSFENAWRFAPKDLVIACWHGEKADVSMPFFARQGFRTLAAAYYDADDLDNCRAWLKVCGRTPSCTGIMYTTWRNKYKLLPDFARLLERERPPGPHAD